MCPTRLPIRTCMQDSHEPRPDGAVQRIGMRAALGLEELLDTLVRQQLLDESQAREVEARATTLRTRLPYVTVRLP